MREKSSNIHIAVSVCIYPDVYNALIYHFGSTELDKLFGQHKQSATAFQKIKEKKDST